MHYWILLKCSENELVVGSVLLKMHIKLVLTHNETFSTVVSNILTTSIFVGYF